MLNNKVFTFSTPVNFDGAIGSDKLIIVDVIIVDVIIVDVIIVDNLGITR